MAKVLLELYLRIQQEYGIFLLLGESMEHRSLSICHNLNVNERMWENTDQKNSKYGRFSCRAMFLHERPAGVLWKSYCVQFYKIHRKTFATGSISSKFAGLKLCQKTVSNAGVFTEFYEIFRSSYSIRGVCRTQFNIFDGAF